MTDAIKPYPMLAHFSAAWCGPCKAMEPSIEALKVKYSTRISYQKVDIDREPDLAEKHNVLSIPTLLWMEVDENGQWIEKGRLVGARNLAILDSFIEAGLNNK